MPTRLHAFTLEETARLLGHYRWVEQRLFEILGAWSGDVREPAARPVLASHAAHHAWHAAILGDRLPDARGFDAEDLTVPPSDAFAPAIDAIARPGPDETIERLVGVYRVLVPRLIEAYTEHRNWLIPISDRPTMRWLRIILDDETADLGEGERLLDSILTDDTKRERALAHQATIDRLLTETGGLSPIRAPGRHEYEPHPPLPVFGDTHGDQMDTG